MVRESLNYFIVEDGNSQAAITLSKVGRVQSRVEQIFRSVQLPKQAMKHLK